MATRQRTPNAMDLLLGAAPKPAPATSAAAPATASGSTELAVVTVEPAVPLDGHTPRTILEETGELQPAESTASELPAPILAPQESPVVDVADVSPSEPAEAVVTAEAAEPIETGEPAATPPAPRPRRKRSRAPTPVVTAPTAESSTTEPAEGSVEPAGEVMATVSPPPPVSPAGRRRRDPDEDLEPAYVPMKLTVMVPAVVLSELIRTVQTIRRMTGRRQGVNQGTVVAAALEMAFEEFTTKGATSQLVDKLRIE